MMYVNSTCLTCGKKFHICHNCGHSEDPDLWPRFEGYCDWECVPEEIRKEYDAQTLRDWIEGE